jgi:hypothetical protein
MDAAAEIANRAEANRLLQELGVALDWRDVVDCADRFNATIADLPALTREQLIERFRDVAAERNSRRR